VPGQLSAGSHAPCEARHTVEAGWKASGGQAAPVPSQVSAASQAPAAGRQTKAPPALVNPSAGHAGPVPVQCSATSHGPAAGRQTTLAGSKSSGGQAAPEPVQLSATSQAPAAGRHTTDAGSKASAGHAALVPSHVSSTSHGPAAGRHTAPPFPARCWQASFVPSQVSVVQRLPSSVHGVPAGTFPSAGHAGPVPVQVSAASHSPAEARHTVKLDRKASGGQALLVPSHVSSTSHGPATGRQTAPAFPAACWQASSMPSQVSVVQGLPSSVHGVAAGDLSSAGQAGPLPVQLSAGSHSPAEGRQTTVEGSKASAGQVVLVPSQVSSTSHGPADARQTVPAFPAGCWQAPFVPSQVSVVHALPSSVHGVPAGVLSSAGQLGPLPVQFSAGSHSPVEGRQTTVEGWKASAGQAVLVPSHVSSWSHGPVAARHTVPAFPAGCWQASFVPSQVSVVHALPSSVQSEPAAFLASGGHACPGSPPQPSATSHSPAAGRQMTPMGRKTSAGQVESSPSQTSSGSHTSLEPVRQTVPAFPAGCWQALSVPSQVSVVHGLPSSVQAVPAALLASAGQLGPVPVQFSAGSHSPAEGRHSVKADRKPSGGHVVLVPSHVSSASHTPAAGRHTAPALPAGCWQASLVPSHASVVHGLLSSVHAVPLGCFASAGQLGPLPVQLSASSHSPAAARQTVLEDAKPSAGHVVLMPVHVSATSHAPAVGRQTAPALPAGCWQVSLVPSHSSLLHGLPSSVHAVPLAFFASAGQLGPVPVQFSTWSHSPAAGRQGVVEDAKPSAGHVLLVPVHVSATSHTPAEARHTVPALPAGCWQATLVPSHWSSVHGLPSLVHAVPEAFFASAGQLGPVPVQLSARSHTSAAARQTVEEDAKPSGGQSFVMPSQLSATSQVSAAGRQTVPAGVFASAGQVALVPVHVSCGSQAPAEARQSAPALPAGCWQALLVPSH